MERVYLETTFISYLVALPARDLIIAAHQQVTREWWQTRRSHFQCVVSTVVLDEVSVGDPLEVQKRLDIYRMLDSLPAVTEAEALTTQIMDSGVLPKKAVRDAAHIAIAAAHGVEYLLTWNCKHLANAQIGRRIQKICELQGLEMPRICTPEELLEDTADA